MRIAYVAGFFSPIFDHIQGEIPTFLREKSVVWVPQRQDKNRQLDLQRLKEDLFDQVARGAEEILLCVFVFRTQEHVMSAIESIRDAAIARNPDLRISISRLKDGQDATKILKLIRDFGPTRSQSLPASLDLLDTWASKVCGDRIVLHPRAIRGAKQSTYLDVELIYKALALLANEYWQMRMASHVRTVQCGGAFTNKLNELGLEFSQSISATGAGEQGEDYWVLYPVGGTAKRRLELHLKKGSDRDARNCLRIYFFWDALNNVTVVGWLPSHLGTRNS